MSSRWTWFNQTPTLILIRRASPFLLKWRYTCLALPIQNLIAISKNSWKRLTQMFLACPATVLWGPPFRQSEKCCSWPRLLWTVSQRYAIIVSVRFALIPNRYRCDQVHPILKASWIVLSFVYEVNRPVQCQRNWILDITWAGCPGDECPRWIYTKTSWHLARDARHC